jgi:methyl-accepting chemotaxis protein
VVKSTLNDENIMLNLIKNIADIAGELEKEMNEVSAAIEESFKSSEQITATGKNILSAIENMIDDQ